MKRLLLCCGLLLFGSTLRAANVNAQVDTYKSSISSDAQGLLDLTVELNYDSARTNQPIAVVMHQFSQATGNFAAYRANAQRLRDQGFFVLTVAMRGRDGSDGTRDSGGVEIYDIYDAVEYVKTQYAGLVDRTNINLEGYSGGGGNVMSAVTKFPDYFRTAGAFFGMSDYGYDTTNGWYYNTGSPSNDRPILLADIGNPNNAGLDRDRYMARASNLASKNNPYTQIHLFVNSNETRCPTIHDTTFRDNAIAAATFSGEFDNIHVHIGSSTAAIYQDFNQNGQNEANERQNWPHQAPDANMQSAAEQWYLPALLAGNIPDPVLNASDKLFVAGYVKTKKFGMWLGDGQNAAADLDYAISNSTYNFSLDIVSSNAAILGKLTVDLSAYNGTQFNMTRNGVVEQTFTAAGTYTLANVADNDVVRIAPVPEPGVGMWLLGGAALLVRRRR